MLQKAARRWTPVVWGTKRKKYRGLGEQRSLGCGRLYYRDLGEIIPYLCRAPFVDKLGAIQFPPSILARSWFTSQWNAVRQTSE
jgi:hypothetical protein